MQRLVVRAASKHFGQRPPVLEAVDLAVDVGEVVGLIGPNGGGKSTLLLLMAGLVRPSSGEVLLDGRPAARVALEAAGSVGLITAQAGLYPALTVRENLRFFAGLYGRELSVDWCERLDLTPHLDRPASELSSGQQQKVSLARALSLDPRVLLFDEPTANLDAVSARVLYTQLRQQAAVGRAVVWCTHDLAMAEAVCDRVVVLNRTVRSVHVPTGQRGLPQASPLHQLLEDAT